MLMNPLLLSAGISAGSKLLGGLFGKKQDSVKRQVKDQIEAKIMSAKKFGISPLAMLGAQTQASAPVSVGAGDYLADMGQDISRAVASQSTSAERAAVQLGLEKAKLENEFLRTQIASVQMSMRSAAAGPPKPPGGGLVGMNELKAPQATTHVNGIPLDPAASDAQSWEDRYWEAGGLVGAILAADADLSKNLPTWASSPSAMGSAFRQWLLSGKRNYSRRVR